MTLSRPIKLSITSGLLLGIAYSFTEWGSGVLMLVAYLPLLRLFAEESPEIGWRRRTWYAYISLVLYHGITNWWIASWQEQTDPYLFVTGIALLVVHPLLLLPPFIALASIRKRLGTKWMLASFPFVLAAFEWLHGQTDFSYPWITSGYALVNLPFAQVADVVGVYGLSFLLAISNSLGAATAHFSFEGAQKRRRLLYLVDVVFLVLWAVVGSQHRESAEVQTVSVTQTDARTVLLVQPNENPWDKWTDSRTQLAIHLSLTDSAIAQHGTPDLVVWSETALPYIIRDPRYDLEWSGLRSWVDNTRTSLLTGVADRLIYKKFAPASARTSSADPNLKYDVFNAAYVVNPSLSEVQVHRKSMLTPFAERLPFADQLTFAMSWIEWGVGISSWGKGLNRLPLHVVRNADTLLSIGSIICIESIYPEVSRDFVLNGANALCVITNDAWYNGTTGPRQHYNIARMRAIETRKPVLRCANSGVSGLISPSGASVAEVPVEQSAVGFVNVVPNSVLTPFVRYGNVVPVTSMALVVFLLVGARIPAFQRILSFRSTFS
jgi:apolipoprotein N-acyltransferase